MATIEFFYRCRIDWDFDSQAAEDDWLMRLSIAEEAGEPAPAQVYIDDASKAIDWAIGRTVGGTDVCVRDCGGGACWNAYIILEGTNPEDVRRVAETIEATIEAFPFCKLIEA